MKQVHELYPDKEDDQNQNVPKQFNMLYPLVQSTPCTESWARGASATDSPSHDRPEIMEHQGDKSDEAGSGMTYLRPYLVRRKENSRQRAIEHR